MSRLFLLSLIFTTTLLASCKVVVDVPDGGIVKTESDSVSCASGEVCVVDVVDTFFDETFIAVPDEGRAFDGWKRSDGYFCGGSTQPCRLFTSGFSGNELLLGILESDREFFLVPQFRTQDVFEVAAAMDPGGVARASCVVGGSGGVLSSFASVSPEVFAYDPAADSWSSSTPMPTARRRLSLDVIDGMLYAAGGESGRDSPLNVLEVYDRGADRWHSAAPLPVALTAHAAASFENRLYVFGGFVDGAGSAATGSARTYAYEVAGERWQRLSDLPASRGDATAEVMGARIARMGAGPSITTDPRCNLRWFTPPSNPLPCKPGERIPGSVIAWRGG